MDNLVTCPFCGGEAEVFESQSLRPLRWWVYCQNCSASGPQAETREQAIENWNTRAKIRKVSNVTKER